MKLNTIILTLVAAAMAAATGHAEPLKVYVLVGQSNMQGHAAVQTLAGMAADPETKPLHDKIADAEGTPREFEDVRMAAISGTLDEPVTKSGPLLNQLNIDRKRLPRSQGSHRFVTAERDYDADTKNY